MGDAELEVRSYRGVFSLERRIYRIDTLRLNPAGVPLRGVAYCVALVGAAIAARTLPGLAWLAAQVPWYFRYVGIPVSCAWFLAVIRIDGRVFHVSAAAILRHLSRAHGVRGFGGGANRPTTWSPPPIVFIADGSEGSFRSLRYHGPGLALVCGPHHRVEWVPRLRPQSRRRVSIHPIVGSGGRDTRAALELTADAVLEVSPRPVAAIGHRVA